MPTRGRRKAQHRSYGAETHEYLGRGFRKELDCARIAVYYEYSYSYEYRHM